MNNFAKYYIRNIFYSTAVMFSSGSVIQIFLNNLGVDSVWIGIYTSLMSVINVVTSMCFSAYADRYTDVKRALSKFTLPIGLCFIFLIPLCYVTTLPAVLSFTVITVVSIIQTLFIALYGAIEYKLPYSIIDMEYYGRLISVNGIISGVSGALTSFILSALIDRYPYFIVMSVGFAAGTVLMLMSCLMNLTFKIRPYNFIIPPERKKSVIQSFSEIVRLKSFRCLIIPNFLRGIYTGILNITAVVAVAIGFSSGTAANLVTISFAANIIGSLIFMTASKRVFNRTLCLIGSILTCFLIFASSDSEKLLFIGYFIATVGKIMVDYSVPAQVYEIISPDIACMYHSWRMIITTSGIAFSSAVSGFLIDNIPIYLILAIASLCQLISGICYFSFKRSE